MRGNDVPGDILGEWCKLPTCREGEPVVLTGNSVVVGFGAVEHGVLIVIIVSPFLCRLGGLLSGLLGGCLGGLLGGLASGRLGGLASGSSSDFDTGQPASSLVAREVVLQTMRVAKSIFAVFKSDASILASFTLCSTLSLGHDTFLLVFGAFKVTVIHVKACWATCHSRLLGGSLGGLLGGLVGGSLGGLPGRLVGGSLGGLPGWGLGGGLGLLDACVPSWMLLVDGLALGGVRPAQTVVIELESKAVAPGFALLSTGCLGQCSFVLGPNSFQVH